MTDTDTLAIGTDTATYALGKSQGRQVAALHHVASKDRARIALCSIHIKYSSDELTFTVTDTYRMAERSYRAVEGPVGESNTLDVAHIAGVNHSAVAVDAVALRDAFRAVKAAHLVTLEVGASGVTVSAGETLVTVPAIDKDYPDTDRLWDLSPPANTLEGAKHLAISAEYLWGLSRATGRTPKDMGPMVLTGSTDLKPIHVRMPGEGNFRAILMPVRV